jgi:hypothetical protein
MADAREEMSGIGGAGRGSIRVVEEVPKAHEVKSEKFPCRVHTTHRATLHYECEPVPVGTGA